MEKSRRDLHNPCLVMIYTRNTLLFLLAEQFILRAGCVYSLNLLCGFIYNCTEYGNGCFLKRYFHGTLTRDSKSDLSLDQGNKAY